MATLNNTTYYTFTPSVSSTEFKAKFQYSQFYSKSKINYQVSAHGIFDHPLLESICINEAYHRSLATTAHTKFISTKVIGTNYLHSKHRAYQNIIAAKSQSFSIREEYRLSSRFFDTIIQGLTTFETLDTAAVNYPGFHSPLYLLYYTVPNAV